MKKLIFIIFACLIFTATSFAQGTNDPTTNGETITESKKKRVIFRATKEQIIQVQTMLKEKDSYKGDADGKFNKDFRGAIKGFQGENGLKKTGTLNRATLEKMGIELTEKQKTIPVNPNSYASADNKKEKKPRKKSFRPTKTQIKEAQTKLKEANKFEGEVTGKYSKDFRAVLKTYQEENGLDKTGKLDEATLAKMEIELTDKQKGIETGDSSKPKRRSFRVNKDQITQAQKLLKEKGLFVGEETGKYSKEFRSAIKDFQSGNGLKRKGSLNRATLEKMGIELTDSQKEIPVNPNDIATPKTVSADKPKRKIFRATKDQIMKVQTMLKEKGLYNGDKTGKLNPATRSAIREWQAQNNVKKTGTLNKVTLEAMGIELTDKQHGM